MDAQDVAKALTISQAAQIIAGLASAVVNAAAAGRDSVTPDELASSFESKDAALVELAASIVRAKTQGR